MKKVIFLIATLVVVLGCLQPPQQEEDLSGFKDCGYDPVCIFESVQSGEKAFAVIEQNNEDAPFGVKATVTSYGIQDGKSKVKFHIDELVANASEDGQQIPSFILSMIEGQEMECLLPPEKMDEAENFEFEELEEYCTGTLVEVIKQLNTTEED